MKTTLKEIRNTNAVDITYLGFEGVNELTKKENGFNEVAYSMGAYGCTGCVVQGRNSKELYKICSRTSALFMVM